MNIYIFSQPIHSGKTTKLSAWVKDKNAAGIISPDIDGKRHFRDILTGETFLMESNGNEEEIIIGKWTFSKAAFERANNILENALASDAEWVIADEIGPLEIKKQGFYPVMEKLLTERQKKILLVVRQPMLDEVTDYFGIEKAEVLANLNSL